MPWHRLASSCTAAFPETRTKRFWHFLQGLLDTILTYTAATTDMEKENTPAAAMDTVKVDTPAEITTTTAKKDIPAEITDADRRKRMISAILWDIDDTLLDFLTAEKAALKALFPQYGLGECSDDMIRRYSAINRTYWERLEHGELTKPEVLVGRFTEFFEKEGLDTSKAPAFNDSYQLSLGDTIAYHDNSLEIVKSLKGRVKQYAVSNGTVAAQTKKLRLSGLGELMDGIFLSEEIGFEKPSIAFFDKVFERLGPVNRQQLLIVGDSLTSDIKGGNNAGILTCWYNPKKAAASSDYHIDYEISDLHEIYQILQV